MKEYYYVRNVDGMYGLLTIQPNKKHLSSPKTEWERYNTRQEAMARLEEWGFVEGTQGSNRYYPEGTFSPKEVG